MTIEGSIAVGIACRTHWGEPCIATGHRQSSSREDATGKEATGQQASLLGSAGHWAVLTPNVLPMALQNRWISGLQNMTKSSAVANQALGRRMPQVYLHLTLDTIRDHQRHVVHSLDARQRSNGASFRGSWADKPSKIQPNPLQTPTYHHSICSWYAIDMEPLSYWLLIYWILYINMSFSRRPNAGSLPFSNWSSTKKTAPKETWETMMTMTMVPWFPFKRCLPFLWSPRSAPTGRFLSRCLELVPLPGARMMMHQWCRNKNKLEGWPFDTETM